MSSLALSRFNLNKIKFLSYFLPIFLVGSIGYTISFLSSIFTTNTRWLLLVILIAFLSTRRNLLRFYDKKLFFILVIYSIWCLTTTLWSTVPMLSFLKSSIYILILSSLTMAGIEWGKMQSWDKIFDYLLLLGLFILLSGFFGKSALKGEYFHGLVNGANMFGVMIAMSYPYFLWKLYRHWHAKKERIIWLFFNIASFYYVFLSMSRASILIVFCILFGFLISLNLKKKLMILFSVLFLGITVLLLSSSALVTSLNFINSYIHKGPTVAAKSGIFQSREGPWQMSLEGAQEGGWTGLGYGISAGQAHFDLDNLSVSSNYGREKGNSQLAIIEEIGLIGFILYLILIFYIVGKCTLMYINAKERDPKIMIGMIMGLFLGFILLSFFEAWWLSGGSPEGIYFWLLVGVLRGLEINLRNTRVSRYVQLRHQT